MENTNLRTMQVFLLFAIWLPNFVMSDVKECNLSEDTIDCIGIIQPELYDALFKYEDRMKPKVSNTEYTSSKEDQPSDKFGIFITVYKSNFTSIVRFNQPIFPNSKAFINRLSIQKSSVTYVDKKAFRDLTNVQELDLSENEISDVSFLSYFGDSLISLNMSNNKITELNLNDIIAPKLNFSNNYISVVRPSSNFKKFVYLDLSFNRLSVFNEMYLNCFSLSLDLSFNTFLNISLMDRSRNVIRLIGTDYNLENTDTIKSHNMHVTRLKSNFVGPNLSMDDQFIGTLNMTILDMSKWNHYSDETNSLSIKNCSIINVAPRFFENTWLSYINLALNNLTELKTDLFLNAELGTLNLSSLGMKKLLVPFRSFNCRILDLSKNNLQSVDKICTGIDYLSDLDISFNPIYVINKNDFAKCSSLTRLFVSNCQVKNISLDFFSNIPNLYHLDLSNNKISKISSNTFSNIKLNVLNLSYNHIHTLEEESFNNLPAISTIDLSGNNIRVLGSNTFVNLSVIELKLSGNYIKYIKTKAFNGLYNLRLLNLSKMGLNNLEQKCFYNLSSIKVIDLSNNELASLGSYTFSTIPVLSILLEGNDIISIRSFAFFNLNKLNSLKLSNFNIYNIDKNAFTDLDITDILDISHNNISKIPYQMLYKVNVKRVSWQGNNISQMFAIENTVNLKELFITYTGGLENRFINNMYLEKLFVVNSNITSLKNQCFMGLYNLKELYFNRSKINLIEADALKGLYNLEFLDAQNLFRNIKLFPKNLFCDLKHLKELNLSNLGLNEIESETFLGLQTLTSLNLSGNKLTLLKEKSFAGLKSLKVLDLSFNYIQRIELGVLGNLINLNSLMLTGNLLNNSFLIKLPNLRELFLNNNSFSEIPLNFLNSLYRLEILRFDLNSLTIIRSGAFNDLINLKKLNLSFNENLGKSWYNSIKLLPQLEYLGIEHLGIDDSLCNYFQCSRIRQTFRTLKSIDLNHNRFSCQFLLSLLNTLTNIDYSPNIPTCHSTNVKGIGCDDQY